MTYFVDHDISLRPVELPNTGFRPGQLGALHSLLAHFSVHDEPALVSLPTGYGKTAVMMAAPFLLRARRVLIVAPTDALRRQTASHFKELSTLRKLNVLGSDVPLPRVLSQTGKPRTAADWSTFENYDVIVSTPQSVSPTGASLPPEALYDLILFDEAHHVPAASWSEILTHHKGARAVFLTATPFRRDRKTIPGRIAYWYPVLRLAMTETTTRSIMLSLARPCSNWPKIVAMASITAYSLALPRSTPQKLWLKSIPHSARVCERFTATHRSAHKTKSRPHFLMALLMAWSASICSAKAMISPN